MYTLRKVSVSLVIGLAFLGGCADLNKEQIGSIVGVTAGAILGSQLGGRRGALIGAALGGLLGNRIGAHLDEEDKKKLAELEQQALATGNGGSFITHRDNARVSVEASSATLEKPREFALSSSVTAQPLVLLDPYSVDAYVDTPVFNSINDHDAPKAILMKGVPMRISAIVVDKDWVVVGEGNVGWGYIPKRYLDPSIVDIVAAEQKKASELKVAASSANSKAKTRKGKAVTKQVTTTTAKAPAASSPDASPPVVNREQYEKEMASLYAAYKPRSSEGAGSVTRSSTPAAASPSPQLQIVQASVECKVLTRRVEGGGEATPLTEQVKYCKEPPKGWQTQTA